MIYFDNAATTPVDPEVIEVMTDVLKNNFGNPSSIYQQGREARVLIENSRRQIADYLNVSPAEIFFTSGGTESDNMSIGGAVMDLNVKRILTSSIEHHAVSHFISHSFIKDKVSVEYLKLLHQGQIDLQHLEELLQTNKHVLVALMHANNEIGNLLPIEEVGILCERYQALFFSDLVQTMGKYKLDLKKLKLHFASSSAHKFHGPKGVGLIYISNQNAIHPMIYGGGQERNMRAGTENTAGIVGMAKAFEIAHKNMEKNQQHIRQLKSYLVEKLKANIKGVSFNGTCENDGLYSLLSVSFPKNENSELLIQNLDLRGISVSAGSACSSGAVTESPVMKALGLDSSIPVIRFSFSKYNTMEEIDYAINTLKELFS